LQKNVLIQDVQDTQEKMHDIEKAWPLNPLNDISTTKEGEKGSLSFLMNNMQKY